MQPEASSTDRLSAAQIVLPLGIGALGLFLQSLTYLNHDVAWVLNSSRWLLEGGQFGREIVAANPPFVWWFSSVPAFFAGATGIGLVTAMRILVAAVLVGSLVSVNALFRESGMKAQARLLFLLTAAFVFTIGVHRDFGQREFLTVLFVLPYLAAAGVRLRGGQVGLTAGMLIGAFAAFGIAFKPYFLAAVFPVELALLWQVRSLRPFIRAEALGALICIALCALGLVLSASPWLKEALPEISRYYWSFNQPVTHVLENFSLALVLVLVSGCVVLRCRGPIEAWLLAAAAVGFAVGAFVQAKGYSYHIYPAIACSLLALALAAAEPSRSKAFGRAALCSALALVALTAADELYKRSPSGTHGKEIAEVVSYVRENVPEGGSYFAISTHPFPAYPTALYADRRWQSASNSSVFLPAVVRLHQAGPKTARALQRAQNSAMAAILRDLAHLPDLVLVDEREYRHAINKTPFDFLGFYSEDANFRCLWAMYEQLESAPAGFAAYRRKGAGA